MRLSQSFVPLMAQADWFPWTTGTLPHCAISLFGTFVTDTRRMLCVSAFQGEGRRQRGSIVDTLRESDNLSL